MVNKKSRTKVRVNKHRKLRNRSSGTAERPRLAVFRSNNHMYAQIIDDTVGNTLVAASTLQKEVKAELEKTNNVDAAAYLGTVNRKKKALEKGITTVVFDRAALYIRVKSKRWQMQQEKLVWNSSQGGRQMKHIIINVNQYQVNGKSSIN